jgi:hypothetical protein
MSDRYLWDRTGRPDRFVRRLERELAAVRARVQGAGGRTGATHGFVRVGAVFVAAAAAALLIAWLASSPAAASAAEGDVAREAEAPVLPPGAAAAPLPPATPHDDTDATSDTVPAATR